VSEDIGDGRGVDEKERLKEKVGMDCNINAILYLYKEYL
jgi:hypothetical protein